MSGCPQCGQVGPQNQALSANPPSPGATPTGHGVRCAACGRELSRPAPPARPAPPGRPPAPPRPPAPGTPPQLAAASSAAALNAVPAAPAVPSATTVPAVPAPPAASALASASAAPATSVAPAQSVAVASSRSLVPPSPPPQPQPPSAPPRKPPPPGPVVPGPRNGKPDELQRQAMALQRTLQRRRWGNWGLAIGTLAVLLLSMAAFALYYRSAVMAYAELSGAELAITRDAVDPERLAIQFRPVSSGRVGFRRRDENRDTELFDEVAPSEKPETLQWRWAGVRPEDTIQVRYRTGWTLKTATLTVGPAPPKAALGDAIVAGTVISATTGLPVAGAVVRLSGTGLEATTNPQGQFRIENAPEGDGAVEISANGYSTEQLETQFAANSTTPLRVALSPGLAEGQIRFVVTWGGAARDLDAHLEGPLPGDQRFHVFHKQKGDLASKEFVSLDVDDRDGEGPETITVLGVQPGRYHYFVHNADVETADALSRSGAEVKVYQGGQTYRFRPRAIQGGNLWRVCDLVIDAAGKATIAPIDRFENTTVEQEGLYAKRTQANREAWIAGYGGSRESEAAVNAGLEWLARHQAEDGHWGPDCLQNHARSRCESDPHCQHGGGAFAVAQTGLAILAFQAGGHFHDNQRKYSENVRRGLEWLVRQQQKDGSLYQSHNGARHQHYMYEHGIGAFALAEANAVGVATKPGAPMPYREATENALRYIQRTQHDDGGWRYTESKAEGGDMSVTGWQVLALKSGKEARLDVSPECVADIERFLAKCRIGRTGRTGYTSANAMISEATTGVGMLIDQLFLDQGDSEVVKSGAEYLAKKAEGFDKSSSFDLPVLRQVGNRDEDDYYLLYNCTLAMFQHGGEPWKRWNDAVRNRLVARQLRGEQCDRGSWTPDARWGGQGGRVYSTALAILTLEVYYRYQSEKAKVYVE